MTEYLFSFKKKAKKNLIFLNGFFINNNDFQILLLMYFVITLTLLIDKNEKTKCFK